MPEAYLNLPAHDRREVIAVARGISLRPPNHLEKDIYVVWTLNALFRSEIGQHLVFKGGTSLSKAYGVLDRFSEDVDLTYDIRAIAGDLVGDAADALPSSRSQEKRWTSAVRHRLTAWVAEQALKLIRAALVDDGVQATAAVNGDKIYIDYDPVTARSGYVSPRVTLEFGARSTGEPNAVRAVTTDISAYVDTVTFPVASPRTMLAERTFWEKATAIHVFCAQNSIRGERLARHWYDLLKLHQAGIADRAIADRALGQAVAEHKGMFFAAKDTNRKTIDYGRAVSGGLLLVPDGEALNALRSDYEAMAEEGLLNEAPEPFDLLIERCGALAAQINAGA